MGTYFVRQSGHGPQGPFEESRIAGWIAQGRVRAEMEISGDGRAWIPVGEHRLFASAALPPAPLLPHTAVQPVQAIKAVEEVPEVESRPRRPARRAPARTTPSTSGALVVGGLVLVVVVGAVGMLGSNKDEPSRTSATAMSSTPPAAAPALTPPPEPQLPTKAEWKKQVGWNGFILNMTKDELVAKVGKPSRTQTIEGLAYWYYPCEDGTIQLILNNFFLQHDRIMSEGLNDY